MRHAHRLALLALGLTIVACHSDDKNRFGGLQESDVDAGDDADAGGGDASDDDPFDDGDVTVPDAAADLELDGDGGDGSDADTGADLGDAGSDADDDAAPGETVRFVAFGDWGVAAISRIEAAADAMHAVCEAQGCDFVLGLGDNFYDEGVGSTDDPIWAERWQAPFAAWDIPFYMSLGNHDYLGTPQAQVSYSVLDDRWTMPDRWYELDAGPVHFAALDTNLLRSDQANGLLDGFRLSDRPWRIGFGHHPMRSNGVHGDTTGTRRELIDWVLCGQADLYLAGHDHDLQHLAASCGVDLVISGAVSQTRDVESDDNTLFALSERGFAWLEVSERSLRLELHDLEGEVLYTWERASRQGPPVCAADDYCEPDCSADPDCAGVDCSGDDVCDDRCPYDPDCFGECPCDFNPGICEPEANPSLVPCGCDTACRGAHRPCVADAHCDTWCPASTDPDCE